MTVYEVMSNNPWGWWCGVDSVQVSDTSVEEGDVLKFKITLENGTTVDPDHDNGEGTFQMVVCVMSDDGKDDITEDCWINDDDVDWFIDDYGFLVVTAISLDAQATKSFSIRYNPTETTNYRVYVLIYSSVSLTNDQLFHNVYTSDKTVTVTEKEEEPILAPEIISARLGGYSGARTEAYQDVPITGSVSYAGTLGGKIDIYVDGSTTPACTMSNLTDPGTTSVSLFIRAPGKGQSKTVTVRYVIFNKDNVSVESTTSSTITIAPDIPTTVTNFVMDDINVDYTQANTLVFTSGSCSYTIGSDGADTLWVGVSLYSLDGMSEGTTGTATFTGVSVMTPAIGQTTTYGVTVDVKNGGGVLRSYTTYLSVTTRAIPDNIIKPLISAASLANILLNECVHTNNEAIRSCMIIGISGPEDPLTILAPQTIPGTSGVSYEQTPRVVVTAIPNAIFSDAIAIIQADKDPEHPDMRNWDIGLRDSGEGKAILTIVKHSYAEEIAEGAWDLTVAGADFIMGFCEDIEDPVVRTTCYVGSTAVSVGAIALLLGVVAPTTALGAAVASTVTAVGSISLGASVVLLIQAGDDCVVGGWDSVNQKQAGWSALNLLLAGGGYYLFSNADDLLRNGEAVITGSTRAIEGTHAALVPMTTVSGWSVSSQPFRISDVASGVVDLRYANYMLVDDGLKTASGVTKGARYKELWGTSPTIRTNPTYAITGTTDDFLTVAGRNVEAKVFNDYQSVYKGSKATKGNFFEIDQLQRWKNTQGVQKVTIAAPPRSSTVYKDVEWTDAKIVWKDKFGNIWIDFVELKSTQDSAVPAYGRLGVKQLSGREAVVDAGLAGDVSAWPKLATPDFRFIGTENPIVVTAEEIQKAAEAGRIRYIYNVQGNTQFALQEIPVSTLKEYQQGELDLVTWFRNIGRHAPGNTQTNQQFTSSQIQEAVRLYQRLEQITANTLN